MTLNISKHKSFSPPFPPSKERGEWLGFSSEKKKYISVHGERNEIAHLVSYYRERRERERHFIYFSFSDVKPDSRLFSEIKSKTKSCLYKHGACLYGFHKS